MVVRNENATMSEHQCRTSPKDVEGLVVRVDSSGVPQHALGTTKTASTVRPCTHVVTCKKGRGTMPREIRIGPLTAKDMRGLGRLE